MRTRKQVSSHIQVLKNTRKSDPHFMRLLTDSVDVDEGFAMIQQPVRPQTQRKPKISTSSSRRSQKIKIEPISSDDSSMSSSPADYVFDMLYQGQQQNPISSSMLDLKDPFFEPFFNSLSNEIANDDTIFFDNSNFSVQDFTNTDNLLQQFFPPNGPTVIDLLDQPNIQSNNFPLTNNPKRQRKTIKKSSMPGIRKNSKKQKINQLKSSLSHPSLNLFQSTHSLSSIIHSMNATWIDSSTYSLWPNYLCLYLEYPLPYDSAAIIPHTLATVTDCTPSCLPSVDKSYVAKEKCPPLSDLTLSPALTILSAKVNLNLNINTSDFFFNNTSFFETKDRRTIECTTTIYSFGNVVLESKEVQQALWLNEGKYMFSFAYVNQFFDAFMKGIRSLQSWEEVDIAINNLCVVQVFEDAQSKLNQGTTTTTTTQDLSQTLADDLLLPRTPPSETILPDIASPLLVMIYEFERGQGTIDVSLVQNNNIVASDLLAGESS
ncbi:hypothetical protein G6F62_003481 [Rhizopus arrhizus]|uniref:YAP binding domain-containing protein n=1 Tax=Rhizopus oryzae TaxID=64495 RepID=A0A9P6X8A2_RHIOR|nr:hypothetical protein G6F23_006460 [Rhizopus arrhizus]KAG0769649.1 hypothetical protein G6F24_000905 [Rhizopus arrhizus]KAG0796189.1 hypothetical protein G6F21_001517 [Rhizopus arrhizus]KAG0799433.1 hypothetical protein G6F22_003233 [Rhizopus arrhizus]KAG0818163.1 hypothetical protein G6F20_001784 [Rhizopus arrhizus]